MSEEEFSDLLRGLDSILEMLAQAVTREGLQLDGAALAPGPEEDEHRLVDPRQVS
jgi:hypothetical protein